MQSTNKIKTLSVIELNNILENLRKLPKGKAIIPSKPLLQVDLVDIVFIAGFFLWYMQHKDEWIRIPKFFELTDNDNVWNHSHYFQQIFELYGVRHGDIFDNFPNAHNDQANSFSRFFAPPICITRKSINCFFGKEENKRIEDLKNKYIRHFDLFEFVDIRYRAYKVVDQEFEKYSAELLHKLDNAVPIFIFIFIITCKRLAKKEKRTLKQAKDYLGQIWHFTQTYVNGLHELAKNIVEHSGQGDKDGQGMITIRAYSESDTNKQKILETHVFDYGAFGIIPKLKNYTEKQVTTFKEKTLLSDSQKKVREAYNNDLNKHLNENFTLTDFIQSNKLEQQGFRHIGHYGINKLYNLIQKPLEGNMYIASRGLKGEQEYFNINSKNLTLGTGTHYFITIPFIAENFKKLDISFDAQDEFSTLGSSDALKKLMQKEIKNIELEELAYDSVNLDNFTGILNIIVNQEIVNLFMKKAFLYLSKLSGCKSKFVVAINLENYSSDESNLLRFLGFLTLEYEQSFVIYNLKFETYKKMIDDNKTFAETRKWENFWHEKNAMLIYSKTQNKDFYFADILYGTSFDDYCFVNRQLSHTFPNTASIVDNDFENVGYVSNINLPDFFNNNMLLPYDILLCRNENELVFYNIKTILQNELSPCKKDNDTLHGFTSVELLEDYINNFGYHISNTHFKIGNMLHSSDFYYAKRLFQHSFYTTRLAMNLTNKISKVVINKEKPLTLVGYEMYSELILSLIKKFLKEIFNYKNVSHFISQSNNNEMNFLPRNTYDTYLNDYRDREIIIIVPIAATGRTTRKIENEIRNQINKHEGNVDATRINPRFFYPSFNIILAQDDSEEFVDLRKTVTGQESIIKLSAKWYNLKYCPLCYGKDRKPLFLTDSASLTPSLIFGNPIGLKEAKWSVKFDELLFDNTIEYQRVSRNNNYRVFDIDTDDFIKKNLKMLEKWLIKTVKPALKEQLNDNDYIVIVAPCHESNMQLINLVNELVFSSSAMIIHHQINVDFVENFSILNGHYLTGKNTKIFFVDDSLITGSQFFKMFDLIQDATKNDVTKNNPLTASIFLNNQAIPIIHDRAVLLSNKQLFAFVTFNQSPTLSILGKRPLEHEHIRYESLRDCTLHDTLCEHFHKKASKLNPQKIGLIDREKSIRHLKLFEATHKIYDYFTKPENTIPELALVESSNIFKENMEAIVNFKLKYERENSCTNTIENDKEENIKALLKTLSHYPFVFYQKLKQATFDWHRILLSEIPITNEKKGINYNEFSTFKFLLRRSSFIDNYLVLENDFLDKLLLWFINIDQYFDQIEILQENNKTFDLTLETKKEKRQNTSYGLFDNTEKDTNEVIKNEENLRDFPIFVLGNYIEMIQKNGWVAFHILNNINKKKEALEKSYQARQFLRMLSIEASSIINDFVNMIEKNYGFYWSSIFNYAEKEKKLILETKEIVNFLNKFNQEIGLLKTNKFSIIKDTFLDGTDNWNKENTPFINFLWVKQLLYTDCIDKNSYIPKEIDYQEKIDGIIEKMKGFFSDKDNVQAFFIVTDGQQKPYVLKDEKNILFNFRKEFEQFNELREKEKKNLESSQKEIKTLSIISFLNGEPSIIKKDVPKTSVEFLLTDRWMNIYNDEEAYLEFMPLDYKWLYLIRISEFQKDSNNRFETQGLIGFYSKKIELKDEILPKQLIMLLRKDMSTFIIKHHKNDEFRLRVEKEERVRFYEEKFEKFNHTAKKHIDNTEIVREEGSTNALFAKNQLVFGQVLLGNKYADYLKNINNKEIKIAKPKTRSTPLRDNEVLFLEKFFSGLHEVYSKPMKQFLKFAINANDYKTVSTLLKFEDIKIILTELICNTVEIDEGKDKAIEINFIDDEIIFRSITGRKISEEKLLEYNDEIKRQYPKDGIGFFMINKIINSVLNKNIKIEFSSVNNEFTVIIPIN